MSGERDNLPAAPRGAASAGHQRICLQRLWTLPACLSGKRHLASRGGPRMKDSTATIHISSAVVSVMPLQRDRVVQSLAALPGVEVHHQDASKVVIVMEAAESGVLGSRLAEIAAWPGVLSANMVFERLENLAEIGD
jgi:nitrate reductase NapD